MNPEVAVSAIAEVAAVLGGARMMSQISLVEELNGAWETN